MERLVGRRFSYKGRRWLGLWGSTVGAGRVLADEPEFGVVHLEILRLGRSEGVEVDICHIPVLWSAWDRSGVEYSSAARTMDVPTERIAEWRARHRRGEVGAFSHRVWKSVSMAWEVVPALRKNEDWPVLAYAYPSRRREGGFTGVEVALARST